MLPPAIASELSRLGHDALAVADAGLSGGADDAVYASALAQNTMVVTENASDYAAMVAQRLAQDQPCVPVVLVRKADHPRGEALAHHLANRLHEWANRNPHPYAGPHWP